MANILVDLMIPVLTGIQGADGTITAEPTQPRFIEGEDVAQVVVPAPVTAQFVAGELTAAFNLDPTPPELAWLVTLESHTTGGSWSWLVAVPDVPEISLGELVESYQIDPETLPPSAVPLPAWVVALNEVAADVADLHLSAQGDLGRQFVQAAPAAVWNFPIPDGILRIPNVTLYDSTGERIEADIQSSLETRTTTATFAFPVAGSAVSS